MVVAVAVT